MKLIYGLADPDTGIVFYVGQSRRGLERPRCHWSPGYLKRETNYSKKKTILDILGMGKIPLIKVLARVETDEELNQLEIKLIAEYRQKNSKLTNVAAGGDVPTIEVCRRAGHKTASLGYCAQNNLKLRKPILATNLTTGEERWYLSASHAAADGIGSRSAISNCLRPGWKWAVNKGWVFKFISRIGA